VEIRTTHGIDKPITIIIIIIIIGKTALFET
jgi:hypothetical protein